jgi:hypothetical protein
MDFNSNDILRVEDVEDLDSLNAEFVYCVLVDHLKFMKNSAKY